jgi:hypothetical protein
MWHWEIVYRVRLFSRYVSRKLTGSADEAGAEADRVSGCRLREPSQDKVNAKVKREMFAKTSTHGQRCAAPELISHLLISRERRQRRAQAVRIPLWGMFPFSGAARSRQQKKRQWRHRIPLAAASFLRNSTIHLVCVTGSGGKGLWGRPALSRTSPLP